MCRSRKDIVVRNESRPLAALVMTIFYFNLLIRTALDARTTVTLHAALLPHGRALHHADLGLAYHVIHNFRQIVGFPEDL